MQPRILIADDEPLLRAALRESLAALWPEADIVGEAADGFEALRMGQQLAPDVVFLDIRMPGLSGLEVARIFGARTHVVFVTAYEEHAVAAFEHGALDYVLKPADPVRLARSIERVRARLGTPPPDLARLDQTLTRASSAPSWLQASSGNAIHFIDLADVVYFCSEQKYTRVVTDTQVAHIRTPIKELAETLEQGGFWQIHRGYMVAVKRIAAVTRAEDGAMWLSLRRHDARLPVSQRFQHRFKGM
ncbi:MAG: LytR/AlgR family response regulator transcription factor [Gammaproteobacteria bacterium]